MAGATFRDCPACPEMVVVPAGAFTMGSPDGESGRDDAEGPQRRIRVESFAAGRFEVTREEFAAFANDTGRSAPGDDCFVFVDGEWRVQGSWRDPGFGQTGRDPVACVSWDDAREYVVWLSDRTGADYRLLSEAEWEYAARAGTTTVYSWGDAVGGHNANCAGCGSRWDNDRTAPSGGRPSMAKTIRGAAAAFGQDIEDYVTEKMDGLERFSRSLNRGKALSHCVPMPVSRPAVSVSTETALIWLQGQTAPA